MTADLRLLWTTTSGNNYKVKDQMHHLSNICKIYKLSNRLSVKMLPSISAELMDKNWTRLNLWGSKLLKYWMCPHSFFMIKWWSSVSLSQRHFCLILPEVKVNCLVEKGGIVPPQNQNWRVNQGIHNVWRLRLYVVSVSERQETENHLLWAPGNSRPSQITWASWLQP